MSVLVAGSVGIDHIKTPHDEAPNLLGGSASYAATSASFSSPVNLVSIVGQDFPDEHVAFFKSRNISVDGVEFAAGDTFRWTGEYSDDWNDRETLEVDLNVLEHYNPQLNESFRDSRIILLANAGPDTQLKVLEQANSPIFSIADTMDLWITVMRDQLNELLTKVDMLVLNDSEAKQLTETSNLVLAGEKMLQMGPKFVILKKGEHGALLFSQTGDFFTIGAYPLKSVHDPTGAGDTFVGGIAGHLASTGKNDVGFDDLAEGILHGTIMASYTCEQFGLRSLQAISEDDLKARKDEFRKYCRIAHPGA